MPAAGAASPPSCLRMMSSSFASKRLATISTFSSLISAGPTGGGGGGGGGGGASGGDEPVDVAEAEAMELQLLRKLVVETKLELAEAISAKETAEHELRCIRRQMAADRDRGSRWAW